MSEEDKNIALAFVIGVFLGAIVSSVVVAWLGGLQMQSAAISNGAAYFKCDQKTGDCEFTWKGEKK